MQKTATDCINEGAIILKGANNSKTPNVDEALSALKEQWNFFQTLADAYEERTATCGFAAIGAILAAFVAAVNWLDNLNPFLELYIMFLFPVSEMAIVTWMGCNFRRQAMAQVQVRWIERKLNSLIGSEVYTWGKSYAHYDADKTFFKNPRNMFIALCAVIYISLSVLCVIRVLELPVHILYKFLYVLIVFLLSIFSYTTLDNSMVRG